MNKIEKTAITIYGAYNEIGGNKILVSSVDSKSVLLDFGFEFRFLNDYFDEFLPIRRHQALRDGLTMGFLPEPKGVLSSLYRPDLLRYEKEWLSHTLHKTGPENLHISHVLISHAHSDHIGAIRFLNPKIKLVAGTTTYEVLKHYSEFYAKTSHFNEILKFGEFFQVSEKGTRMNSRTKNYKIIERSLIPLQSGYSGDLNGTCPFILRYFDTDHSIPGAGAYFLTDKKTHAKIIYTGDIRFHGPLQAKAYEFINFGKKFAPDILITEGTRLGRLQEEEQEEKPTQTTNFESEELVCSRISEILSDANAATNPLMIFFTCPMRDTARLESFYFACKQKGRKLVLLPKSYLLLQLMIKIHQSRLTMKDLEEIGIFISRKSWGLYEERDYSNSKDIKKVFNHPNTVKAAEIEADPNQYCLQMSFFNLNDLLDIRPPQGSHWIRSESEPFNDEGAIKAEKITNWLALFGITKETIHQVHCSGHMSPTHLEYMINTINPRKVLVVHSENPKMVTQMSLNSGIEYVSVEKGKKVEI